MENAVQALKMGAAILIFTIALATTFMVFAQAKQVSEVVFTTADNDNYMEYIEGNSATTNRIVGIETIIPMIYNYNNKDRYWIYIVNKSGATVGTFEIANEVGSANQIIKTLDEKVEKILLQTSLKNAKFEESFEEHIYEGNVYTDPVTGETIEKINTQKIIHITYKEI